MPQTNQRVFRLKYRAPAVSGGYLTTWWAMIVARTFREASAKANKVLRKHRGSLRIVSLKDLGEVDA